MKMPRRKQAVVPPGHPLFLTRTQRRLRAEIRRERQHLLLENSSTDSDAGPELPQASQEESSESDAGLANQFEALPEAQLPESDPEEEASDSVGHASSGYEEADFDVSTSILLLLVYIA